MVFQQVVAHHDCCYKIYAFFGRGELTLRKSLDTAEIFMSPEGNQLEESTGSRNQWYSTLDLISRKTLDSDFEKSMYEKDLLPRPVIDLLVDQMIQLGGMRCCGLDLIVEEETLDIFIIDLNDMPSYIGVPPMADKAFTEIIADKLKASPGDFC